MLDRPMVSVIIPVYRTSARLLERCLKSLQRERLPELEIILTDDGNRKEEVPETTAFLDRAEGMDPQIRVLRLAHGGVSRARNAAAAFSRGTYITCLDSDDEWVPEQIPRILHILDREQPDLLIAGVARKMPEEVQKTEGNVWTVCRTDDGNTRMLQRLRRYYITMSDKELHKERFWINRAPHGRFVRRDLALEVPFRENLAFGEDVVWNFDLLHRAGKVCLYLDQLYCYHQTEGSATQRFRPDFPEELKVLLRCYEEEIGTWPETDRNLFACAAIEYFTVMCRVYVFAGDASGSRQRFYSQIEQDFWRRQFRAARLSDLRPGYRAAVLLGRAHAWDILYNLCRVHYRA